MHAKFKVHQKLGKNPELLASHNTHQVLLIQKSKKDWLVETHNNPSGLTYSEVQKGLIGYSSAHSLRALTVCTKYDTITLSSFQDILLFTLTYLHDVM